MALVTKDLDREQAGANSWAAVQDAQRRNENNKQLYTADQRRKVITALDLLDNAYEYSESFVNYRQKFVALKLSDARVKNRQALKDVESFFEDYDVEKIVSAQGVIYRFRFV